MLVPDTEVVAVELSVEVPTSALELVALVVPDCIAHEIPPITCPRKSLSYSSHKYAVYSS